MAKKIVASQMFDYVKERYMYSTKQRGGSFSVIETSEEFVDYHIRDYPIRGKVDADTSYESKNIIFR